MVSSFPLSIFLPTSDVVHWSRSGDLIYLDAAGQPVVIINSQRVAAELLDQRATIYSDRPHNVVADMITGGLFFGFSRYGEG